MGAHHHSASAAHAYRGRLAIVLSVNFVLFVAEVVGGLVAGSLALLADSGHMLVDTIGVGMSVGAIWFAGRPATSSRTYGHHRLEILAAVANAVLLLGVGVLVTVEAVRRLITPPTVASGTMLTFGLVALVGNASSAWLLRRGQAQSLAVRSAFLDVVADMLGGAAVVIAAILIALTGFRRADPITSIVIAILIIPRTWQLLRRALDVLLEATPEGVEMEEVRRHILDTPGVADVHDLHAWTITSGMNVLSAHVVLQPQADGPQVLDHLGDCLSDHFDIEHSTFQLEPPTHRSHEASLHR